jgi:hypothetical protein
MKKKECIVNVYLLNEHFSPEYAEAQHNGKESENNLRYEWEDEFAITSDVLSVTAIENASLPLQGEMPDGQIFSHEVSKMLLFEIASSVMESKAEVASSNTNKRGLRIKARAMDKRCFSPPDNFSPPSPITVSMPFSLLEINPSQDAWFKA